MNLKKSGSYIDEMLRQTRMHHVQLSSMADVKANMLLTMSSVLITLAAPQLTKAHIRLPFIILIIFCLLTIVLAAYSAMPKISLKNKNHSNINVKSPTFNLLFFGDFSQLDYDQYEQAMAEIMGEPDLTYEAQIKELYILGKYLATKKYFLLRLAYLTFIVGLVASGLGVLAGQILGVN
ncbi:MAG: hypothetical protein D6813_15630 [Calditrichaeota bacterium]|nr:MAG: hypothetical protein D6813_15630 [Calditrichota bacterium]